MTVRIVLALATAPGLAKEIPRQEEMAVNLVRNGTPYLATRCSLATGVQHTDIAHIATAEKSNENTTVEALLVLLADSLAVR